jgi:hypothetical protein
LAQIRPRAKRQDTRFRFECPATPAESARQRLERRSCQLWCATRPRSVGAWVEGRLVSLRCSILGAAKSACPPPTPSSAREGCHRHCQRRRSIIAHHVRHRVGPEPSQRLWQIPRARGLEAGEAGLSEPVRYCCCQPLKQQLALIQSERLVPADIRGVRQRAAAVCSGEYSTTQSFDAVWRSPGRLGLSTHVQQLTPRHIRPEEERGGFFLFVSVETTSRVRIAGMAVPGLSALGLLPRQRFQPRPHGQRA